jgi:trehalose 6-phosphate phosphatase
MRSGRTSSAAIRATGGALANESEPAEIEVDQPLARPRFEVTPRKAAATRDSARSAFRNWASIREQLRRAKRWAFFLDFDGTLVDLRPRPGDVRMPRPAKLILRRLAAHANTEVAIVSGRTRRNVRELVAVNELRYFGVHGGEREGRSVTVSAKSKIALEGVKSEARQRLKSIPGVWIQDKGLSIAIHYRDAKSLWARTAGVTLAELLEPWKGSLHLLNGSRVWEILPREIPGKFTAVEEVLGADRAGSAVVYVGNDGTDEVAFAALPNSITVRVGREPDSSARYFVRNPTEVLRLLARMERELS